MSTATIRIGADTTNFRQGLTQAVGQMQSFAKTVAGVAGGQALFAGLQAGIGAVGSAFRSLGETFKESISSAGEFEAVVAQFTTFYKSAETAQGAVAELAKYAATTSFQLGEVANAGAGLAAAGVPAEQLKESIRIIGDIAAATKKPMAEILQPYVKTLSVGKMQTETFLQFLERGIPIGEELKKALNLSDAGLQKALTEGKISAQDMVNALQAMTTTGLFSGAATTQGKTLNGLLSTLADNVEEVKRNLGLAASEGLKPLIEFAQNLTGRFAPIGTALGNIFTAATQKALLFSDQFTAGFGRAVDTAVNAFQIIEGAIKNGTLWDILTVSAKLAFTEVQAFGIRALQGLTEVFSGADLIGSLAPVADSFINRIINAGPAIGAALESPLGKAFIRAVDEFVSYLKQQIGFAVTGLADIALPSFISPTRNETTGRGMRMGGLGLEGPIGFASGGITSAQAGEMLAAQAAGYPTPLTPGEVRETFANGRRITYNTKESLSNGAIIPPSNSDAYAEGTPGQGLIAAFERGFARQTSATERLQSQNEKLKTELAKLTEAALKNATAIREQSSSLKNQTELTAKTAQAEEKKSKATTATGDFFTSLEKIGGGRRTMNLAPRGPVIGMEGREPGLRGGGDLGGGFAASAAFLAAKKREEIAKVPVQGPPAAEFFQMRAQQLRTPRMDFDVAPAFPLPGGGMMEAKDPAVRVLQENQSTLASKLDAVVAAITKQGSLNVAVV
jgi:tape measure domain-containing protein